MTEPKNTKAADAQKSGEYSASEANKNNQKENAQKTGNKPREGRDPMEGDEQGK